MTVDKGKIKEFLDSKPPIGTLMGFESYRHWLADLLITLQRQAETFSGKRPNCDSGWGYDLAVGLAVVEPHIIMSRDEDGIAEIDWMLCDNTFREMIEMVFRLSND